MGIKETPKAVMNILKRTYEKWLIEYAWGLKMSYFRRRKMFALSTHRSSFFFSLPSRVSKSDINVNLGKRQLFVRCMRHFDNYDDANHITNYKIFSYRLWVQRSIVCFFPRQVKEARSPLLCSYSQQSYNISTSQLLE